MVTLRCWSSEVCYLISAQKYDLEWHSIIHRNVLHISGPLWEESISHWSCAFFARMHQYDGCLTSAASFTTYKNSPLLFGVSLDKWYHEDVMTWKWFPHYWLTVRGIHWVSDRFPSQRTSNMDFFIDKLNKMLNKWSCCQWFEMPWFLWAQC